MADLIFLKINLLMNQGNWGINEIREVTGLCTGDHMSRSEQVGFVQVNFLEILDGKHNLEKLRPPGIKPRTQGPV